MSRVFTGSPSSQSIRAPASSVYNTLPAFTLAAWINVSAIISAHAAIIAKSPSAGLPYALQMSGGFSRFLEGYHFTQTTASDSISTTAIPLNTWTHVAMTYDSNGDRFVHLYINGVEPGYGLHQSDSGPLVNDSTDGVWIGSDNSFPLDGSIAEAAIWNQALSGAQIATLAASTSGVPGSIPSPVGYWHLCGVLSPEPDSSGNGNNGTLFSSPAKGSDSPGFNCNPATIVNDLHTLDSYIFFTRKAIIGENLLVPVRVGKPAIVSKKVGRPLPVSTKVGGKLIVE